jgi:hypothetical protein
MTWAELKERLDANGVTVELARDIRTALNRYEPVASDDKIYVLASMSKYFLKTGLLTLKEILASPNPICLAFCTDKPVS